MKPASNNSGETLPKIGCFRTWTKEYRFVLFSAACELLIVCRIIFHDTHRMPLDEVVGIAAFGAFLSALMSIFIDRSPWPGIVLFWLSLSSLLIVPI